MPILRSTLSIKGLYDYDNSIFDGMLLPEEYEEYRDLIINMILTECSELEIIYPNPEFMKNMIVAWSEKNLPYWQRYFDLLTEEYDPLHNYTRHTVHNGSGNSTVTDSVKGYNETSFVDSDRSQNYQSDSFTRDITGNIGNTSFSKLLEEEIELRLKYNPIDLIVDSFKHEFCILLY